MTSTLAANALPFNALIGDSSGDHDVNLMLDFDEIFSEVVAAFDPVAQSTFDGVGPATAALGAPNSLLPSHASDASTLVSPSSSCNRLNAYAEATTEPTKISEMTFIAPSTVAPNPKVEPLAKPEKSKAPTSSTKKRRHSAIQSQNPEDEEVIEEQRRQRNRDHARRSRQRKKSLTGSLQTSLEELKAENAKLREQIYAAIGKTKADAMVKSTLDSPTLKFIAALKKPENRTVDSEALKLLQGLRAKVSSPNTPVKIVA